MYQFILVPLDGSSHAEQVLPHVIALAKNHESRLILLGVVDPAEEVAMESHVFGGLPSFMHRPLSNFSQYNQQLNRANHRVPEMRGYLEIVAKKIALQGINVEACLEVGHAVDMILWVARDKCVQLIAMTSWERTGFGKLFKQCISCEVQQRSSRPLLLIRQGEDGC